MVLRIISTLLFRQDSLSDIVQKSSATLDLVKQGRRQTPPVWLRTSHVLPAPPRPSVASIHLQSVCKCIPPAFPPPSDSPPPRRIYGKRTTFPRCEHAKPTQRQTGGIPDWIGKRLTRLETTTRCIYRKELNMLRIILWLIAIKVTISVPWNLVCLLNELRGESTGE